MAVFIPGLELSRLFWNEAVQPILIARFPDRPFSAALIGWGSEVLGYDTEVSTDHHWGPRLLLFVEDGSDRDVVDAALRDELPTSFHGYSTSFGTADTIGVRLPQPIDAGPVEHMVEIFSPTDFFSWYIGWNPDRPLESSDWLSIPEQRLLAVTAGAVFHDGLGRLVPIREQLRYYPHELWIYLLAAQWHRISQEEAFMGRCAHVGDDLGSRLVAARLTRDLMKLCFLMEQRYAPYTKWFGTAFATLNCSAELLPVLQAVLGAENWPEREVQLAAAYRVAAQMHNALAITAPLDTEVRSYYDRPYLTINAGRFADALRAKLTNPALQHLPPIGKVDQVVDSVDVLTRAAMYRKLEPLWEL